MSRRRFYVLFASVLCGLLILLSILHLETHAQAPTKGVAWTGVPCSEFNLSLPAESNVSCGYVTAPLRHAAPDGPTIQLATVVLPSSAADHQPDPLFMAQGGPGGSTIGTYAQYLIQKPDARPTQNRDIVLWDQRGTLFSKPALMCPEVSQADLTNVLADTPADPSDDGFDPYQACGDRLAAEAGDLSAFNSAENADDIEDVRVALGYAEINFYGVSYGTELGQFVMRQQPDHLRSVILDAVVPLDYNLMTEPAFAKERIAEKYFGACATDVRCNAKFPDLAARYLALIDRLNEEPVVVTMSPELTATESYQIRLTGSLLESSLYGALYTNVHDLVPLIIDQADKGNFTFVSTALLPQSLLGDTMATGMYLTVACADRGDTDPSLVDYSTINPRLAEEERQGAEGVLSICQLWGIDLLPRSDLDLVVSDIPTLLLSGDFDPITPPEYAETLLPNLAQGKHVIFPSGSHGQAVTSVCSNGVISSFLDSPTGELDTACTDAPVSGFVTSADVITLPPLQHALAAQGLNMTALVGLGLSLAPGLLIGLFLLSVIPIYGIGWIISLFRRQTQVEKQGWSRAAPWLALAAAIVLLAFELLLVFTVGATLVGDRNLLLLSAIPGSFRWVFFLPPLLVVLVGLMLIATIALWRGPQRSLIGRLYYTLLTLAGISGVIGLYSLDVMAMGFG